MPVQGVLSTGQGGLQSRQPSAPPSRLMSDTGLQAFLDSAPTPFHRALHL